MVSGGACDACAMVGLEPCFEGGCAHDGSKPGIGTVSLTRPTGKKAPRRPGMPETLRLAAVSSESQKIGEFLEWLAWEQNLVLAEVIGDSLYPSLTTTEKLLARFYGIDLERVERERGRLLAYIRAKGNT